MKTNHCYFLIPVVFFIFASFAEAQWVDGQPAQYVIGQPDFTSHSSALTSKGLGDPQSVAIDVEHGKLYIADSYNNRVLRYAYPITSNEPVAEFVFGQQSFSINDPRNFFNTWGWWPNPTPSQLISPSSVAVDHGDLWICDAGNYRVVKFDSAFSLTINGPDANAVLGQKDFVSRDYATTRNTLSTPWAICIDANRTIWVSDACRVLRFDSAYTRTNGADADQVLGQTDFLTNTVPSSPTSGVFGLASSLWMHGTTLWVSDLNFNRVLRFDSVTSKGNGGTADGVLGQALFTTSTPARTRNSFDRPFSVCVDNAGTVYVGDQGNLRVMIYKNGALKANGGPADGLLGQDGFFSSIIRIDSIGFGGAASIHKMDIDTINGKLLVTDQASYRVLVFSASGPLSVNNFILTSLPKAISLSQNYPNPFNPTTTIGFTLAKNSKVLLKVYDLLGREVATLVNNEMKAGVLHKVSFDGSRFVSGIYFYRLQAGNYIETRKLVLLK